MQEYVRLSVRSEPAETQADFSDRLTAFWTLALRNHQPQFECVYAETTEFETDGDRLIRRYVVEPQVVSFWSAEIPKGGFDLEPVDEDDTYSKYEAVAPEWMQIEH